MMTTTDPRSQAWSNYRKLLKQEEPITPEEIALARDSFTEGWGACEKHIRGVQQAYEAVRFERLMSYRTNDESICARDAIFDFFCKLLQDPRKANIETKRFTDALYQAFTGFGRSPTAPAPSAAPPPTE